jgi:hypothetical protein
MIKIIAKVKVYVVSAYRIDDYENVYDETRVYKFKSNALQKLQDIKNQDFMPIVEDEGFEIHCDNSTHFEAGYEGDYSRGCVCVKIVETNIEDAEVCK